jgi:hypothetical protein
MLFSIDYVNRSHCLGGSRLTLSKPESDPLPYRGDDEGLEIMLTLN